MYLLLYVVKCYAMCMYVIRQRWLLKTFICLSFNIGYEKFRNVGSNDGLRVYQLHIININIYKHIAKMVVYKKYKAQNVFGVHKRGVYAGICILEISHIVIQAFFILCTKIIMKMMVTLHSLFQICTCNCIITFKM